MDEERIFPKHHSIINMRHLTQIILYLLLNLKFYYHNNLVLYYFPDSDFSHPIYNKHLVGAKSSRLPACLMSQQTPFQNPNSPHQRQHAQCHARSLFLHAAKRCTLTLLFSRAVCWEEGLPSKGCSLQLSFLQASGSFCSFELTEASTTHWRFVKEPASM
jgi:hypothetical protein